MTKKTVGKRVLGGLAATFLPMQAVENVRKTKDSAIRIGRMLKTGKGTPPIDGDADPAQVEQAMDVAEGRKLIMALDEHARFEAYVDGLEMSQEQLDNQTKALKRGHTVRLCVLFFCITFLPYMLYTYGLLKSLLLMTLILYTVITILKDTVMLVQIEERALWSFGQLRARPGHWLYRRAFWFQD